MQKNYCLKKKHNNKGGFCSLFELFLNKSSMKPAGFPANAGCLTADRKYRKKTLNRISKNLQKIDFRSKAKGTGYTGKASHPFLEFFIFFKIFFSKNNKKNENHGEKDAKALLFLVILRLFCLRFPGRASPFTPANSASSLPSEKNNY